MLDEQQNTAGSGEGNTGNAAPDSRDLKTLQNDFNGLYGKNKENERKIAAFEKDAEERAKADQLASDKAAADRGEFDTVLKAKDEMIATLQSKSDQWDTYQTSTRERLLEKLPEDQRDTWKTADLTLLEAHVSSIGEPGSPAGVVTGKPGSGAEATGKATSAEIEANYANPAWRAANAHRL
jgi:hypothetical protein